MSVTLSIKNVPESLAERLRARAKRHHRSLQGELLAILEEVEDDEQKSITVDELWERGKALGLSSAEGEAARMIREDRDSR